MTEPLNHSDWNPNRGARRRQKRSDDKNIPTSPGKLDDAQKKFNQSKETLAAVPKFPFNLDTEIDDINLCLRWMGRFSRVLGRNKTHLYAPRIHHSEPAYIGLTGAARNFHTAIENFGQEEMLTWLTKEDQQDFLDDYGKVMKDDLYAHRHRGNVSLADIEKMNLPLQPEDIRAINASIKYNPLQKDTYYSYMLREIVLLLPTQVLAKKQETFVPEQIKPLIERLVGYMDYYLPAMLENDPNSDNFYKFLETVSYLGTPFMHALGAYMPIRTGLTPSSLVKLYDDRRHAQGNWGGWNSLYMILKPETSTSYTVSGLPKNLFPYQLYDNQQDARASTQLGEHYKSITANDQADFDLKRELNRLRLYRRKLYSAMIQGMPINLEGHPVISSIVLACQNKQNMMFVLLLNDGQTHLTLETTEKGEVYGIPHHLKMNNPKIEDLLLKDVLNPTLTRARNMFPQIETSNHLTPISSPVREDLPNPVTKQMPKGTKRRHFMSHVSLKEPELPVYNPVEDNTKRSYQLVYDEKGEFKTITSDEDLSAYAGKTAKSLYRRETRIQGDVESLLTALRKDPKGAGTYKLTGYTTNIEARRQDLWGFRGDDRGIKFQHPESRRLRVVYCFDPMNPDVVIIEDILHHDTFDIKYTS